MNNMNGNPHYRKAVWDMQHNAGTDKLREDLDRDAQVEATLALAFEQRTTALIAMSVHLARTGRSDEMLEHQILARLGLNGEQK